MTIDTEINEIRRLAGLNEQADKNELIRNTWDVSGSADDPRIFVRFAGILNSNNTSAEKIIQQISEFLEHCERESEFLSLSLQD